MPNHSIIVEGLSKKFGLSLRDAMKYGFIDTGRRLIGRGKDNHQRPGEFWALDNVNFTLEQGDALGIMGVNGSGKTTLLRILNGTYSPDTGKVTLRGRIGALIAAGAGFSPMLTGRENIYLSAALLGMTPSETNNKFDEIVNYAGLNDFIDMPVRNYSSGMTVRLGFSVAVMGTPEILLIDEILAVGDINFQKKCYERIIALKEGGTTILLVSHSPGSIWAVCNKALILHKGRSSGIIPVEEACKLYEYNNYLTRMESNHEIENTNQETITHEYGGYRGGTGDIFITKLEILDYSSGIISKEIGFGENFLLRCHVLVKQSLPDCIFRIQVDSEINKSIAIIDSYESDERTYSLNQGTYIMDISVERPNLRPGVYFFSPSIVPRRGSIHYFFEYNMAKVIILHPENLFFYADYRASMYLNTIFNIQPSSTEDF